MKLLVVEDDNSLAATLSAVLRKHHYTVDCASDGQEALNFIEAFPYELLLLDVMLPKLDGISLCQQLRRRGYHLPILLLTARDTSTDKVVGLDAGADDYLVKPFIWEELLARIRTLVRRKSSPLQASLEWGDLYLEPNICQVTYSEQLLHLTPKEYSLLELFLRYPNQVFSYDHLLDHLWSFKEPPSNVTIRSHIKGLRQKLKAAGAAANVIQTVYGIGYRLKSLALEAPARDRQEPFWSEPSQKKTMAALTESWERFKPDVLRQVAVLEQTATTALQIGNSCSNDLRQQATTEAHNLAGLLGTFGFTKGSKLSREMENLLQAGGTLSKAQGSQIRKLAGALRRMLERPLTKAQKERGQAVPFCQDKHSRLLIVDDDEILTEGLKQEAAIRGIEVEVAINPTVARIKVRHQCPDVVLLDPHQNSHDGLTLLAELTMVPIPVLILTRCGSFTDRLKVCRLKAHTFLQKPMPPKEIMAAVSQVLQQVSKPQFHILIVDDDPQMLVRLRTLLESLGLKLTTLIDSRLLWNTLEKIAPDLLILDVKMPHVDGIELCQVVRNEPRWSGLPIMALTAYTDPETVQRIFTAGADDIVGKQIVESELVSRIMTRLERSQFR